MTPLAVSSPSPNHSSLPVPSFGAFTQSPPDPTPQVSRGQQPDSLPCLSNQAPLRCTVRAVQTHMYLCSDLNTNLDSDARILHRWVHLATRIHTHWAKSRDPDMHVFPWGQTQGPQANPLVFRMQGVPRCTGNTHLQTLQCACDLMHLRLSLRSSYRSVHGYQCMQTECRMPFHGDTHRHARVRKAALTASPRGIPSQLVAFSKTGSHLLFGVSSACVKLSAPRNRAQAGGLGFPRCAHDGPSPPHSASPPTRSSLLSAGKVLRLEVIKSLFSLQQH